MDVRICLLALLYIVNTAATCVPDSKNACRDYSSAETCQLTEYCKINVWSKSLASESKLCKTCKTDIGNLQKFISAKTTKDFVKYDLLALCRACPFASGRNECRTLIDENFDKIYDDIVSKLDPNVICRALHICQDSARHTELVVEQMKQRLNLGPLWLPGPVKIEEDICFTAEKCSDYSTASKCGVVDMCKQYAWSTPVKADNICAECKAEMKMIHDWVANNQTKSEIKKELLMFCDQIPIQILQQKCHNTVIADFDAIYNELVVYLDADVVCSALGLCKPALQLKPPSSCELDGQHACLDYASAAQCNTLNYCQYVVWNAPVRENDLCQRCMDDVDKLRDFLDSNTTREHVEGELLIICKLIPWQSLKFKCQTTVLHNFERIYHDIMSHLNSSVVCRSLFLCRNEDDVNAFADAFLSVVMSYDSEDDSAGCKFCKGQMKAFQDWMKSAPTKQAVETKFEQFCDDIKLSAFRQECQSMVSEHFDEIYDDLIAMTDPDALCKKMKICAASKQISRAQDTCNEENRCADISTAKKCGVLSECKTGVWSNAVQDDNICRLCQGQIKALQDFITDNATKSEVKQGLTAFCNGLKLSAFKNECLSLVTNNFEDIYADLTALLDPSTVCTYLKLCNQVSAETILQQDASASCHNENACADYTSAVRCNKLEKCRATAWSVPTVEGDNICVLCKAEIGVLQNWLKDGAQSAEVRTAMEAFCEGIPLTAFRDACSENVKNNFDGIYKHLTDMVDPDQICTGLTLCKGNSTEKYLKSMMDNLPALLKVAMKNKKLPIRAPFEPKSIQTDANPCTECEAFVGNFQNAVFNEKAMAAVLEMMKPKCEAIDGNGALCDMITYHMMMEHGREPASPSAICKATNMCIASSLQFFGDGCSDCKSFLKMLQHEMKINPAIVTKLVETASNFYCLRKSADMRTQCVTYMKMVINVMIESFQYEDTQRICKKAGFCTSATELVNGMLQRVRGEPCGDCKAFVTDMQTAITNKDPIVNQLLNLVEAQCQTFGLLSSLCVDFIKDKAQDVLKQFVAYTDDTVCDAIRMCPGSQNRATGDICTDCKAFFADFQALAVNNKSAVDADVADLKQAVCSQVPSVLAGECDSVFDKESAYIVNALSTQTPEQTCDDLYFCDKVEKEPMTVPAVELLPANTDGVEIPGACEVCELVMKYVDSKINVTSTEKEIENVLLEACSHLPKYKVECDNFVEQYASKIIDFILEEGTSPLLVCKALQLCSTPPKKQVLKGPAECDVCEVILTEVQHILKENVTETAIVDALSKVCSVVQKYKTECKFIIKEYGPTLINILANEVDPRTVCTLIKLCTKAKLPAKQESPSTCGICTLIAEQLDQMLSDKSTEAEIEQALESVCTILPSKYAKECRSFIETNFPKLMEELVKDMNPKVLCVRLHLCPAPKKTVQPKTDNGVLCDVCTEVASELDKMLGDNATQAEIEAALETVCNFVPSGMKAQCKAFIESNYKMVVDFLVKEMNPKVICVQLHFCAAQLQSKVNSGPTCELCTLVASKLDAMLNDSSTQAEIEHALETVCSILPADFKTACDNLIQQNFQAIVDFLVAEMNPKMICVQLKLCAASTKVNSGPTCELCTIVASELDAMLSESSTQAEIEHALETVCSVLPADFKATCDDLIQQNFQAIVNFLVAEMNPKMICVQLKLCAASPGGSDTVYCEVCTLVATQLDKMLSENSTEAEIKTALETVCGYLPASIKATCDGFIDNYLDTVMALLVNEMNPKVICVQIGVCPALISALDKCETCKVIAGVLDDLVKNQYVEKETQAAMDEVCTFFPDAAKEACRGIMEQAGAEMFKLLIAEMAPDVVCSDVDFCPKKLDAMEVTKKCAFCEMIAEEVEACVANNSTQAAIELVLESVCHFVPDEHKDNCVAFISSNYHQFMVILMKELQPAVICGDLKMCPAPKVETSVTCEVCTAVMQYIDSELADNATQAEIESVVLKACNFVPSSYKQECDELIKEYEPMIVQLIISELSPKEICVELGLCPKSKNTASTMHLGSGGECAICKLVMGKLEEILSEESTEKEILAAVESVCNIVPGEYKNDCKVYIDSYGPAVIAILVQDFVPETVCEKLGLCTKKATPRVMKMHVGSEECTICKEVIRTLDEFLEQNYTEAAVTAALRTICKKLPDALQSQCVDFVNEYAPMIFQYIDKIGDPAFVCQHLKLCPTELKQSPLLGGEKCTYGPSYWCISMETASECHAVQHCTDHVW